MFEMTIILFRQHSFCLVSFDIYKLINQIDLIYLKNPIFNATGIFIRLIYFY